jgi:hypothetical protein
LRFACFDQTQHGELLFGLALIALSGIVVSTNTVVPGTTTSIEEAQRQGLVFFADLPQNYLTQSWGIVPARHCLLYFPLVMIQLIVQHQPYAVNSSNPLFAVWQRFRHYLMNIIEPFHTNSSQFETVTYTHLAFRAAMAAVLAQSTAKSSSPLVEFPVFHILGLELPLSLKSVRCIALDLPLSLRPTPVPSVAQEFRILPTSSCKTSIDDNLSANGSEWLKLSQVPLLVHTGGNSNPFDGLLAFRALLVNGDPAGAVCRFWFDNKFSGDVKKNAPRFSSVDKSVAKLRDHVAAVDVHSSFNGMNFGVLITNRRVADADRVILRDKFKLVVVGDRELDWFISPTLAPIFRTGFSFRMPKLPGNKRSQPEIGITFS